MKALGAFMKLDEIFKNGHLAISGKHRSLLAVLANHGMDSGMLLQQTMEDDRELRFEI